MNCREALELFDDHLEENLSPTLRWRLRLHLWICRHCRKYLASYKTTVRAVQAAFGAPVDGVIEEIPDSLARSIVFAATTGPKRNGSDDPHAAPEI